MTDTAAISTTFVGVTILLALVVSYHVGMTRATSGKMLAFVALFMLPAIAVRQGFAAHMEQAKTTKFCLSCHIMDPYGQSLLIDDPSFVPATHYQNHLVSTDQTCFTCHTTYTMFGDYQAKFRGLRHLYIQYLGTRPKPEDIKLYVPFNNRECLHCHAGMRKYEEATQHRRTPQMLGQMRTNQLSCTASDCHEFIHDVGHLSDYKLLKPVASTSQTP
jgi:nitrate/TMAO reductase-like tetraheme cytochrome c subunit